MQMQMREAVLHFDESIYKLKNKQTTAYKL